MANGIGFEGSNKTFIPAPGTEDRVSPIEVFDNGVSIVQCWELTPDEAAEIARTGKVYLSVLSRGLSPMFVGSESTVLELLAVCGGAWK